MGHDWDLGALPSAARVPPQIGPYQPLSLLGQGGMGRVYRARELGTGREVALKVLMAQGPESGQRFAREAELTARLSHPGIVRVHASGQAGTWLYIAYELIEGARPFDRYAAELPLPERLRLLSEVCAAVGSAHGLGIVHRDLKPENVLVDAQGRTHVADFGLASALDLEALTRSGAFLGTPHFMSPQQLTGDVVQGRLPASDVWALGVMAWESVSGALPFEGQSLTELTAAVVRGPRGPLVPSEPCSRALAQGLAAVCARALAFEPGQRYPEAGALGEELERVARGEVPRALQARRRKGRARWLALAALALGGAGALAWGVAGRLRGQRAAALSALQVELSELRESRRSLIALRPEVERIAAGLGSYAEARASVHELLALSAMASGELEEARGLASSSPLVSAVLSLSAPELPLGSAASVLAGSPLQHPELELWRCWAELDADRLDPRAARRAAQRAAQLAPEFGAGQRYWLPLRARLLARAGDFEAANSLGASTLLARAQLGLELAAVALTRGDAKQASAGAAALAGGGPRLAPARARVRDLAQARLSEALQSAGLEPERQDLRGRLRAALVVLAALGGGEEPPQSTWEPLMASGGLLGIQPGGLALDFAEAFPDSLHVQTQVASAAMLVDLLRSWGGFREDAARLVDVAERSWRLAPGDSAALIRYLNFCERFEFWERLVAAAESTPRAQIAPGALPELDFRHAQALVCCGRRAEGLLLFERLGGAGHRQWSGFAWGELTHLFLREGRVKEARRSALRYLAEVATDAGTLTRRQAALTTLWREWRANPSTERALQGLESIGLRGSSEVRLDEAWETRLAYLLALRGRLEEAQLCLTRVEGLLRASQDPGPFPRSATEIAALRAQLSRDAEAGLEALRVLVDSIEGLGVYETPLRAPSDPEAY